MMTRENHRLANLHGSQIQVAIGTSVGQKFPTCQKPLPAGWIAQVDTGFFSGYSFLSPFIAPLPLPLPTTIAKSLSPVFFLYSSLSLSTPSVAANNYSQVTIASPCSQCLQWPISLSPCKMVELFLWDSYKVIWAHTLVLIGTIVAIDWVSLFLNYSLIIPLTISMCNCSTPIPTSLKSLVPAHYCPCKLLLSTLASANDAQPCLPLFLSIALYSAPCGEHGHCFQKNW